MGRKSPFPFDYSKCLILESLTFQKNCKNIHKKSPPKDTDLENLKFRLQRNALKTYLRYSFSYNELNVQILYIKWSIFKHSGKSKGARIWFCLFKRKGKPTVIFLTLYTHGQGVVDIEKHEAIKSVKKAFNELDIT